MVDNKARVLILGAGPAGYTAALYAARALLEPVLISGPVPGGQLTITTDVENYPGFKDPIQGPWLMEEMQAQAMRVGTRLVSDTIISVDLSKRPFHLTGDSGKLYEAESLIIATGAEARWLGLESERQFRGFGVSACATCDGFFFRDKKVVVVGGGNTAVEEALFLTHFAEEVVLVHRRDQLRAEKILEQRARSHPKIRFFWSYVVEEIRGRDEPRGVQAIVLRHTQTGDVMVHPCDGVFIAIGHTPATSLFQEQLALTPQGYIVTEPRSTKTSVSGVFAAGDVTDDLYRQAVTAAGMGCMAALDAERFLAQDS